MAHFDQSVIFDPQEAKNIGSGQIHTKLSPQRQWEKLRNHYPMRYVTLRYFRVYSLVNLF